MSLSKSGYHISCQAASKVPSGHSKFSSASRIGRDHPRAISRAALTGGQEGIPEPGYQIGDSAHQIALGVSLCRYPDSKMSWIDVSSPETENFRSAAILSRNLANLSPCTPNRDEQHQGCTSAGNDASVHSFMINLI